MNTSTISLASGTSNCATTSNGGYVMNSGTDNYFNSSILTPPNTVSFSNAINFTNNTTKQIMQNKVAVFKVTRDKDEKIIKTEFIKELWVETKGNQSVDFQVARDKDLAEYEMSDIFIKTLLSVSF
jgi:hypothetical protein